MKSSDVVKILCNLPELDYKPASAGDRVYQSVKRAIMIGALPPGAVLTLRGVGEAFGISPVPAREAVLSLVNEGVVTVNNNRSFSITKLTAAQFDELRCIRLLLEGEAIERAAERIDRETIERAKFFQSRLVEYAKTDQKYYHLYNNYFHVAVYRSSAMPFLVEIIEKLWLRYAPTFFHYGESLPLYKDADFQLDVVNALEARNSAAAREAMFKDINTTADAVLERIAEYEVGAYTAA